MNVYNRTLALRINAYKKFGLKVGKFDLIKHLTKLKNREKTTWLKEADSQALGINRIKTLIIKLIMGEGLWNT